MSIHDELIKTLERQLESYESELELLSADDSPETFARLYQDMALTCKYLAQMDHRVTYWLCAISYYESALHILPEHHVVDRARIHHELAQLHLAVARYRDANEHLWRGRQAAERALVYYSAQHKRYADAYYDVRLLLAEMDLGLAYTANTTTYAYEGLEIARDVIRKIQADTDETSDVRQKHYIDAHRLVGLCHIRLAQHTHLPESAGHLQDAVQVLRHVRKYRHHPHLRENNIRALNTLALAYSLLADVEANPNYLDYAIQSLHQAVDLNPDDQMHGLRAANLQMLAVLYGRKGDYEQAAAVAELAAHYFTLVGDDFWAFMATYQSATYAAPEPVRWLMLPIWWLINLLLYGYHRLTGRMM